MVLPTHARMATPPVTNQEILRELTRHRAQARFCTTGFASACSRKNQKLEFEDGAYHACLLVRLLLLFSPLR